MSTLYTLHFPLIKPRQQAKKKVHAHDPSYTVQLRPVLFHSLARGLEGCLGGGRRRGGRGDALLGALECMLRCDELIDRMRADHSSHSKTRTNFTSDQQHTLFASEPHVWRKASVSTSRAASQIKSSAAATPILMDRSASVGSGCGSAITSGPSTSRSHASIYRWCAAGKR